MTLMTKQIWQLIVSAAPPHPGFRFQPVEGDGYIGLKVFLENFANYSRPQQEDLAVWMGSLCKQIRDLGTPCFIEGDDDYQAAVSRRRHL